MPTGGGTSGAFTGLSHAGVVFSKECAMVPRAPFPACKAALPSVPLLEVWLGVRLSGGGGRCR